MKYSELKSLIDDIGNIKYKLEMLDNRLNKLSNIEKVNCNVINISGNDYVTSNDSQLSKDFSKFIYDSLVTYYTNLRESYYKFYNDKMNELKSVCDNNKTIDFNEEIIKLMI